MNDWIKCDERMPIVKIIEERLRESDPVLVFIPPRRSPSGNMTEPVFDVMFIQDLDGQSCWHDGDDTYLSMDYVTHWMPLPSLPEH